jgi:tetratricopeptide (TPR) repeat protein
VLERLGKNEEAAERIAAALEILAGDQLDAEVGELNRALGGALVFAGEYERAAPPLDVALTIGEALKLPGLVSNALTLKASLYLHTGRAEEARCLFAGAIAIAQRHDLSGALGRAQANSGNLATQWDLPDAGEQASSSLAVARRCGDRYMESISAGNLTAVYLMCGRWAEAERIAAELVKDNPMRVGATHADYPMVILHVLRGQPEAARASLERLNEWSHSDDEEHQAMHSSASISVHLAAGRAEEALEQGKRMLSHAIDKLGASNQSVRNAWPEALAAALALARPDDAHWLLTLLAERPPGHIPPYLEAHLIRGRARLAAAEGRNDTVEEDLNRAVAGFQTLGYPYWVAVTQADLVAWLTAQQRGSETAALLSHATAILRSLGAAPALARARELEPLVP